MALVNRVCINCCPLLNTFYCKCTLNIIRFQSKNLYNTNFKNNNGVSNTKTNNEKMSFHNKINFRKAQAKKSILVQLKDYNSVYEVQNYCEQFGKIISIYHYCTKMNNPHCILMEFESLNSINNIKEMITYMNNTEHIPIETRLLLFNSKKQLGVDNKFIHESNPKFRKYSLTCPTNNVIREKLQSMKSISKQMIELHNMVKFTDLDKRLRFYTMHQVELCFSKLFPTTSIMPFGSSANGFGQIGCDLDLVFIIGNNQKPATNKQSTQLIFQSKLYPLSEKYTQRQFLSLVSSILKQFIPGVANVTNILEARVPIIKFENLYTTLYCDLSSTNSIAIHMTEILYIFGEMDSRVKPLVCTIRKWAKHTNVVSVISPSPRITNFSLTLLIIFYLQTKNVLPSIESLLLNIGRYERLNNTEFAENSNTKESLHSLLVGFFEYYSTFKFGMHAICLRVGKPRIKSNNAVIYIANPFDTTLNVCQNVTGIELSFIISQFQNAFVLLQNDRSDILSYLIGVSSSEKELKKIHQSSKNRDSILEEHNLLRVKS